MEMKYIRFGGDLKDEFVVFSNSLIHLDVARKMQMPAISAGFVLLGDDGPVCYGRSVSMGVKSLPEDTKMLRKEFK